MARMAIKRAHTSVYLDADVLHLLDDMEKTTGNNRSQLINDAVRGEYSWRPKVGELFKEAFEAHRRAVLEQVFTRFAGFRAEFFQDMRQELSNRHASQNKLIKKSKRCLKRSNQY